MAVANVLRPFAFLDPSVPKDARDILQDVVEIGFVLLVALATAGGLFSTTLYRFCSGVTHAILSQPSSV
jgi:hypothetical protein